MLSYLVTFRWHETDTWCTNIVKTDIPNPEEAIRKEYKNMTDLYISPISPIEAKSYIDRGMPTITINY